MHPPLQARSATGSCQADNQGPSRLEIADLSAAAASLRISDILMLLLLDGLLTRSSNNTFDECPGNDGQNLRYNDRQRSICHKSTSLVLGMWRTSLPSSRRIGTVLRATYECVHSPYLSCMMQRDLDPTVRILTSSFSSGGDRGFDIRNDNILLYVGRASLSFPYDHRELSQT